MKFSLAILAGMASALKLRDSHKQFAMSQVKDDDEEWYDAGCFVYREVTYDEEVDYELDDGRDWYVIDDGDEEYLATGSDEEFDTDYCDTSENESDNEDLA